MPTSLDMKVEKVGLTQQMKNSTDKQKNDEPKLDPRLADLAKYFDQTDE